jgi:hypothetical protein
LQQLNCIFTIIFTPDIKAYPTRVFKGMMISYAIISHQLLLEYPCKTDIQQAVAVNVAHFFTGEVKLQSAVFVGSCVYARPAEHLVFNSSHASQNSRIG